MPRVQGFACHHCTKRFKDEDHLNKHVLRRHPEAAAAAAPDAAGSAASPAVTASAAVTFALAENDGTANERPGDGVDIIDGLKQEAASAGNGAAGGQETGDGRDVAEPEVAADSDAVTRTAAALEKDCLDRDVDSAHWVTTA